MISPPTRPAVSGEEFYGFVCANPACHTPIILGQIKPEDLDSRGGVQIQTLRANHTLTCQQCGQTGVYQITQIQRFLVATKH
jgi:hypothetical protein